jgi:hypothetical protein
MPLLQEMTRSSVVDIVFAVVIFAVLLLIELGQNHLEARMKALAAMRDAIKRDFLTELEASAILQVNGTPVIIAKQRTCGLCGHGGHNARTLH